MRSPIDSLQIEKIIIQSEKTKNQILQSRGDNNPNFVNPKSAQVSVIPKLIKTSNLDLYLLKISTFIDCLNLSLP